MEKDVKSIDNKDFSKLERLEIHLDNEDVQIEVFIGKEQDLLIPYNFVIYREISFQLLEKLDDIIRAEKIISIIIDLNGTLHLDSIAISTLISIKKLIQGDCQLINVDPSVLEIFEILNLDKLFVIEMA